MFNEVNNKLIKPDTSKIRLDKYASFTEKLTMFILGLAFVPFVCWLFTMFTEALLDITFGYNGKVFFLIAGLITGACTYFYTYFYPE